MLVKLVLIYFCLIYLNNGHCKTAYVTLQHMFTYLQMSNSHVWATINLTYCFIKPPLHKKMKFSIKGFLSKCDQIRSSLRIWSHILKNSLLENLLFCVVHRMRTHLSITQWQSKKTFENPFIFSGRIFYQKSETTCNWHTLITH